MLETVTAILPFSQRLRKESKMGKETYANVVARGGALKPLQWHLVCVERGKQFTWSAQTLQELKVVVRDIGLPGGFDWSASGPLMDSDGEGKAVAWSVHHGSV